MFKRAPRRTLHKHMFHACSHFLPRSASIDVLRDLRYTHQSLVYQCEFCSPNYHQYPLNSLWKALMDTLLCRENLRGILNQPDQVRLSHSAATKADEISKTMSMRSVQVSVRKEVHTDSKISPPGAYKSTVHSHRISSFPVESSKTLDGGDSV